MRKLFIASGVLLAGVLVYGAVGSGAWFTDSESVPVSAAAPSRTTADPMSAGSLRTVKRPLPARSTWNRPKFGHAQSFSRGCLNRLP